MIVMMGSSFTVIPYLTMYATKNVGFPESMLWLMYLLGGATTLLTSPRIGKWADVAGKLKVFRIMALCSAVPILLITHAMPMPMWLYLCISTTFFITVNGRVVPAQALVAGAVNASMRGTFMGLQSCAMSFGLGLASLVGGYLIDSAADGRIVHFEQAGYVAICAIAIIVWLSGKIQQRA
jgi:predicted MFS family arabinose efflux permease